MKPLADHILSLKNKTALVRCNFDVPIEDGQVLDTTRIEDSLSTINLLLENDCRVVLIAHYDRPGGKYDESKNLRPVASVLEAKLGEPVSFIPYSQSVELKADSTGTRVSLLDNLRFWSGEETPEPDFAQELAQLGDFYVNQAFANCHRNHTSMTLLAKLLPAYAGVDLAKEIEILSKTRNNPDKPLVVVIGGAKLETKEPLVSVFADKADHILVGGKVAFDIKAKGLELPDNVIVADLLESGRDITPESARQFADLISSAQSVIWNGTMGVFEESEHQTGTEIVAKAVNQTPAFTLVGGGDTETALTELDLESNIDFISTGGGAMLTYLSEGTLIAIKALESDEI